jgi:protein-S-isoprenylcysteine O-methyltransferase Ste14
MRFTVESPVAAPAPGMISRIAALTYGTVVYTIFLATFLYAIGFAGNILAPKSIDSGKPGPLVPSLVIDALLLTLFAVQHSGMARPGFKRRWTKIVPAPIERSTFVLFTCICFALLFTQWRPLPYVIWKFDSAIGIVAMQALYWLGWGIVLIATIMIHHFDLFGLRQVCRHAAGLSQKELGFRTPGFYRYLRHPIMLGFLIAFWAAPTMTAGHLVFSVATTAYIFVGIALEERDLGRMHSREYQRYRERVPMLIPSLKSNEISYTHTKATTA